MNSKLIIKIFKSSFFVIISFYFFQGYLQADDSTISVEKCKLIVSFDQSFQAYLNNSFQITQSLPKTDKNFEELKKSFHTEALRIVEKYFFRQRFFLENEKNENLWSKLVNDKKRALALINSNNSLVAQSYNPFLIQRLKLENSYLYSSLYTIELLRKDLCQSHLRSVFESQTRINLKKDEPSAQRNIPTKPQVDPVK
jgi:hypothetical protein